MRVPRRRAVIALGALLVVVALLVAREGTARTRAAAGGGMVLFAVALIIVVQRERAIFRDPYASIERLAGRIEPERAARALRALSLLEGPSSGAAGEGDLPHGTSRELATLHVARMLKGLPHDRIALGASRLAFRFAIGALVLAAVTLGTCAQNPWSVIEGADVLVAVNRVAPIGMVWLDDLEMRARPPDYLHEEERRRQPFFDFAVPHGTLITVRGLPAHAGRRLALTDGDSEVPFVDDGAGHMIARWPITKNTPLRVVARFGDVVIPEPRATGITSIADEAPIVELEGAPRRIALANAEDAGDIPIRYEVEDDHGLREVHLVLRSGTREERRVLARLDGETRRDRGGYVLRAGDSFLKKSHAPVEVLVAAKDNDPISGPKWGESAAITVVPPEVGEPEALRMDAMHKLRDALVDSLAWRISHALPSDIVKLRAMLAEEIRGADEDAQLLDATLSTSYAGLRIAGRLQAMLRGQMRKVRVAMDAEAHGASATTHGALVKASERMVLVVDGTLRGLGQNDTKSASRKLAEVADDLALGTAQMQRDGAFAVVRNPSSPPSAREAEKVRGAARVDAATMVLEGGERSMKRLGSLGRDIGEIIETDLLRVARARKQADLPHAELAARDLAARLREPDPSFGSRGRSGHGGGESGGGRGTPGEEGEEGSDAEQAFNEAARDLEQLAQDHAEGVGKTEQALSSGASEDDVKALSEEAKKHAQAVREATRGLPSVGGGSDSWTSKGAASREHGEQMARSLEQGNPADAVSSGRSALQALDEAKRTAAREHWLALRDPNGESPEKRIDDAKKKLEPEVRWAEQQLEQLRKKAADRAVGELSQRGDDEEKMANRAKGVGEKGRDQGALPEAALEDLDGAEKSAREAARALKQGDADRALKLQREAQGQLERAKEALGKSEEGEHGGDGDRDPALDHADIPKADAHKGPEEFRKRVVKGLGQPASGRQKDAVRRYAEGLLR